MRQHIHEYLKTMIYRYIIDSKYGVAGEDIKKGLSVTAANSVEFDACMNELKDDGVIVYDGKKGLWRAA